MSEKRQKNQLQLAFMMEGRGENLRTIVGGTEAPMAEGKVESLAEAERLMEEILDPENLREALKRVKAFPKRKEKLIAAVALKTIVT